ncbi:unnamed protein product [Schistosoma haematobium]|nr:unnamed protein product [Schistosoma haematobium]CAH8608156.1 unnamed protein product [Schistosoma haematobium]
MRGDYIILYIYMVLFMLFNEINASGRTPKFVNVDEDGNLRGETTDVTKIFDAKKTLGSAFVTLFYQLWYLLKQGLGLP